MPERLPSILLVDDDLSVLTALTAALGDLGKVSLADNLQEGLRLTEVLQPEVIVTDYRFEEGNGLDLAERAATLSPASKVILISGFADKHVAIRSLDLRVHALLEKPFALEALRTRLRSALPPVADFVLYADLCTVKIKGRSVRLTPTEFTIFETLHQRRGKLLSRDDLQRIIWPNTKVSANTLDTHFINLRKKLPEIQNILIAVRGRGFALE